MNNNYSKVMLLGPEISTFIENYFELFTIVVVVEVVLLYYAFKKIGEYIEKKVKE